MKRTSDLELQAQAFARYHINQQIDNAIARRYVQAVQQLGALGNRNERLLAFMLKHPWSIGLVDAGLGITDPHSEVRRRLYVMLAILESSPKYVDAFLPQNRSPFYIIFIGYVGVRAVLKALFGIALVGVVR